MRGAGYLGRWSASRAFLAPLWLGFAVLAGCSDGEVEPGPAKRASFPGVKLTVGALGEGAILEGLSAQRGEWVASRQGEMSIRSEPLKSLDELSSVDLLIFPGQSLGELVDGDALEVIPNATVEAQRPAHTEDAAAPDRPADPYQYDDVAPAFRDEVTRYGKDRLALPLGGSALVLVYRREAFTRAANVEAAKAAGLKLEPPTTWTRLDALAQFFQGRDWDGDGKPDHGIAAVLGRDGEGLGNATFLARAASLGQHRDQYSFLFDADAMKPRVDSPPFVEALRGVIGWKDAAPPGVDRLDGPAAREAFRAGKVAILIDRAEKASTWSSGTAVGVAALPGSERVFEPLRKQWETPERPNTPSYLPLGGGWLVGIRKGLAGTQREAAVDMAVYLSNPENVNRLRAERTFPMLPVRSSVMGQGLPDPTSAPDVDPRQWSDAVSRTLQAERVVPGLRIPEAAGYLDDLSAARAAALAGKDPEAALGELAGAWDARTKARGRERQLWHYRRSLNALSTLPAPPPRGK